MSDKETIQKQAAEIDALRAELRDERLARELKRALLLAGAAHEIACPISHSRLLYLIVEASAHVTSADAASLFLIDEEAQQLRFEVAIGPKSEELKDLRLPLGHGIAGLVAATGQPIIVADAATDPRHSADVAVQTGFFPKSILCVPLVCNDRVIGVLEVLDKQGTHSFSPRDMEMLGLFAKQAALAIELSSTGRNLAPLLADALRSSGDAAGLQASDRTQDFVHRLEQTPAYKRALDLATLVRDIAWNGESEFMLCQAVLRNMAEYVRSRHAYSVFEPLS